MRASEVIDALTRANCKPSRRNTALCPACRKGDLKVHGHAFGCVVTCSRNCPPEVIFGALDFDSEPVVPVVPTPFRNDVSTRSRSLSKGTGGTTTGTPVPVPDFGNMFEGLAEFLQRAASAPPTEWLLEKLVPGSGKVMLVAAPNAGKTWLALILAKTAAELGRRVLIVEEEGGLRAFSSRISALGFSTIAQSCVRVAHLRGVSLDDMAMVTHLCGLLAGEEAPVLIFDPLNSVWSGDENETHDATLLRQVLDQLARANPRALIVMLHHTSKAGEKGDGPALYASRGSTVFSGWADAQLNLTYAETPKGAGQVAFDVLTTKMRDDERGHRVRFNIDLGTSTVSMEERSKDRGPENEAKVLAFFKSATEPISKNGLRGLIKMRTVDLGVAVDALLARGALQVDAKGRLGIPLRMAAQRELSTPEAA